MRYTNYYQVTFHCFCLL